MAPSLPLISDLDVSSLELDTRTTTLSPLNMLKRDIIQQPNYSGAIDPSSINNKGVQAAIALICVAFILGIIWFFFWAKNGGFQWQKGDWDDYKSTVLRRKGPNGTTLSNATKSTILGGGSVVGDGYSDRDGTESWETGTHYTGNMTELSSNSTAPIVKKEKDNYTSRPARSERRRAENAKDKKQREMREAEFEGGHDNDVRAYMREKPARVGGINTTGDTMHYGTDYTDTESSVGGYSQPTAPRDHTAPAPPIHREHTQSQPNRTSRSPVKSSQVPPVRGGRDFSYTIGGNQEQAQFNYNVDPAIRVRSPPPLRVPAVPLPPTQSPRPSRYHGSAQEINDRARGRAMPGAFTYGQPAMSQNANTGTKAYHHPLPGLAGAGAKTGGGFRRGQGDSEL